MILNGLTYDAGALIAADRGDRQMWLIHQRMLARHRRPTVSAAVLAQAWRGGPQAQLSRLLRGCEVEPVTEARARSAGSALAASRTTDIVDAVVVVTAAARGDAIVTSDPRDLQRIADATGRALTMITV